MMYNGKNPLLPPKSPFPSKISPSYTEYIPRSSIAPKPRGEKLRHQRTSSESFLEEQPSWLDELLNEPETPVRKGGHRRSSSDSFAYTAQDDNRFKNITPLSSSWGPEDIDFYRDVWDNSSFYPEANTKNKLWDTPLSLVPPPLSPGFPSPMDNSVRTNSGSVGPSQGAEKESLHVISSALETDTKRTKQQYAQRSRVRKLQYIAELERNVQALQAEGSEASAELEFTKQRNLILSLENKTLKQRLESSSALSMRYWREKQEDFEPYICNNKKSRSHCFLPATDVPKVKTLISSSLIFPLNTRRRVLVKIPSSQLRI